MGVAHGGCGYNEHSCVGVEPKGAVPAAVMDITSISQNLAKT